MKKIFTLIAAAFAAVAVNAQDWNATKSGTLATGTVILDNDYVSVKTAVQDSETALIKDEQDNNDPKTFAGFTFTKYVNIRVAEGPAADNDFVGTPYADATPLGVSLVVTAKQNTDMTLYYKHGDGKQLSCYDQTAAGSVAIAETGAGIDNYYTGVFKFIKDHVYTIYATGGTTGLSGITTAVGTYVEPAGNVYSYKDKANLVTYGDGAQMQITGNTEKQYSKGGATIKVDGAGYSSIKNSNGAQNTFVAPTGKKIYRITFYAVPNSDGASPKFQEFAGATVDYAITTEKDGDNPTAVIMCINGAESVTFTYGGAQVNFVMNVDYSEASYDAQYDPTAGGSSVQGVKAADEAAPAVKKIVKNGQVILVNGDAQFNAAGAQVK
ncbi:MAG: hypothetical protein IKP84_07925 [Prevotella sp.]|nr:hypothetical protein [Prevotella sp.]